MANPASLTTTDNTVACLALTSHVIVVSPSDHEPSNQAVEAAKFEPNESAWSQELYYQPTADWSSIAPGVQVRKDGNGIAVRTLNS